MGQARDRRKRAERKRGAGRRREEAQLDVRRRVKGLLQRLKLLAEFEAMPAYVRDQFYYCCCPDPVLVFDPSFPSAEAFGGKYADIREEVTEAFAHAGIELTGFVLPVKDFTAIAVPIESMLRTTLASLNAPVPGGGPRMPASIRAWMERASGIMTYLVRKEVQEQMFRGLHSAVVVPLVARSRLDGNLLHARLSMQGTSRARRMVMTLYAEKPELKYVRLRSKASLGSRPLHRVGTANVWNGIEWASWSRANLKGHWQQELGLHGDAQWPVFVQSHALKQLRDRLNAYAYVDWSEHWMHQSLANPKIVSWQGNELLVAYEVQGKRLGYLVVTAADGCIAVRTFLFLTMEWTPEGILLEKRLNMTRHEVRHWGLDELSGFTHTDLKHDPFWRERLRPCGVGHLFELTEDELVPTARPITPLAAELKQYVGLAA